VVLKLIIEADGSISEVELLRGIGGGCDEEAIRLVKNMPKWIPAQQNDRKVRVQVILPIRFKLMIN
jgi:periplasmic protein TonB